MILNAYQRAIHSTDEANLVVVKGGAGSGKTAVAQSLQEHVIEDGGFFITWKFYHLSQIGEGDGFVDAFTSLTNQILAAGEEVLREIRTSLQALGKIEFAIILDLVPCLEPIMGPKQVESKANSVETSGRQMEAFKNVMRAICTKDRPLVIFFDDVQFSDTCSLSLLEALVSDAKNEGVMYMAAMGPERPISDIDKLMQGFSDAAVHMTTVELVALNEETTNMMVADILHVDREISAPMTAFLHHYTQGNALFLIELLNLMYANGVLTFEEQTRTWNYDEDKIDCVYDCKDFRSLIRSKISRLSQPVKEMLKGT
jgi:predicted ATPase